MSAFALAEGEVALLKGGGNLLSKSGVLTGEASVATTATPKGGLPAGITFEGSVYRGVNPKYANSAWEIHGGNIGANHRYSDVGRGSLYAGTWEKAVLGELAHYGVDPNTVSTVSKNLKLENVLDLTNPAVRQQLGVTLEQLTSNDYFLTHAIGDFARTRYSGMLVPSARAPGTSNLVIFPGAKP